ncbi:MAG: SGNH/GDSL hydrolase family protein [Planctomycetota bacterium]|nr:SGNH/GDSL hydrolase family protein [Planctomycetota bacterium]
MALHPQFAPRLSNPAYLRHAWFSRDFLVSSFRQPGGWLTPRGTRLVLPQNYQDAFFTVTGGCRETPGFMWDSAALPRAIFCLGGSTTYCSEVPDAFTWPAQLQAMLRENANTRDCRVINLGASSVHSGQEVERLRFEIERGRRPFLCIFLNGINDIMQGVFYNNPGGVIFESEKQLAEGILLRIAGRSAFFNLLRRWHRREVPPPHLSDPDLVARLAVRTAEIYESNLREARRICEISGSRFAVFLQPCLFTLRRPLSAHEAQIAGQWPAAARFCCEKTYPQLRERIARLQKEGFAAYDITDAFDTAAQPIFLDYCHVECDGNRLLAERIYQHILPLIAGASGE